MARTAKLVGDTLYLTEDGVTDEYVLERLDPHPSVGHPAVRLNKMARDGSSFEQYDAIKAPHGWRCDCPWGTYGHEKTGKPCRHLAALLRLGVIR